MSRIIRPKALVALAAATTLFAIARSASAQSSCGEVRFVPENVEVTFSPDVGCLLVTVEGESLEGCGGSEIVLDNRCMEDVFFSGWSFDCAGSPCESIEPGRAGRVAIDIEARESYTFTFDGYVGSEVLQVVVKMDVERVEPGCAYAPSGSAPDAAARIGLGLLAATALLLRTTKRRRVTMA